MKKNIRIQLLLVTALILIGWGCAFIRPVVHTLNDVARALCENVAGEQSLAARQGMTASDWCAIQRNLDPFIDIVTSAKQEAMTKAGFKK